MNSNRFAAIFIVLLLSAFTYAVAVHAYAWCEDPDPSGCETKSDGRCCTDIICGDPPVDESHCGWACAGKCDGDDDDDGGDDDDDGGDPCAGVSCPDTCEDDVLKSNGYCSDGSCIYNTGTTCSYGCAAAKCNDPDNKKTLCEGKGFLWMPQGTDGGKCCGDDPSNTPPTAPDSGRVLDSATSEHKEWLCTVPASGPVVTQSAGRRGEVVPIPVMASDALSSGSHWYVCDSKKNSIHNPSETHKYDWWDGRRVDDTCRYVDGIGFYCGEITGSDMVEKAASSGTPTALISDTIDNSDDGKWYNYYGRLLGGTNEDIGSADNPLKVTLSGLDPSASYVVTIELANDAQGNNFYVRIGNSGTYKRLGEKYNAWKALEVGKVNGTASTSVQFYYEGKTSATIRMAVRNIRAVKVGVPYAEQRPVVELDHDYVCGTGMLFGGQTLAGERFIECCGSASECKTEHALHTKGEVEVNGTTWVCAGDYRFYDKALVDSDRVVCELLGYLWSGDACCGNDPTEQLIWSWRGEQKGCCYASSSQCLVDNNGSSLNNNLPETFFTTEKGPHCIASSQHMLNHFCDAGTWRSRNKGPADKLLKIVKDKDADNYVLFCDDYENALAYYNYVTSMNNPLEKSFLAAESCYSGSKDYPCFNTFCVAAAPDKGFAVVGGSYNYPKNVSHVEELTGEKKGACDPALGKSGYHKCSSSLLGGAKLWFAEDKGGFIYSTDEIRVPGSGLWEWIKSKFDAFFNWLKHKHTLANDVMTKADTYERFYVLVADGEAKTVFGREEGVYTAAGYDSLIAVDFTGFSSDLCAQLADRFPGSCNTVGGTSQYVSAEESEQPSLFELWQYLTSALRVT